jgi:HTH-type transcriptional regulator/antitoxin MqsA
MTASHDICPICGEGHLERCTGKNTVEYKGQSTELDMQYSVCDACSSEQADAAQLRTNKRAMTGFKKHVDGLLIGAEVRALRECFGINQAEAARIFGGGPVAFSKYESDDVAQSGAMDKLLRLAAAVPAAFAHLAQVGIEFDATAQWTTMEDRPTPQRHVVLRVIKETQPMLQQDWRKTG